MLEIVLLLVLCRQIGAQVRLKGQNPIGYQLLAVVLLIGGEFGGAFLGRFLAPRSAASASLPDLGFAYLLGLLGAAFGAGLAYAIARNAPPARRNVERDLGPFIDLDS